MFIVRFGCGVFVAHVYDTPFVLSLSPEKTEDVCVAQLCH